MDNRTVSERFAAYWVGEPNSGCWLWTGHALAGGDRRLPYGRLTVNYKSVAAHRLSWELHRGPITDGLCVLHKCDTPLCVNPLHLFLGTYTDNNRDKVAKGRHPKTQPKLLKAACIHGHLYTAENSGTRPNGHRFCRACAQVIWRKACLARKARKALRMRAG